MSKRVSTDDAVDRARARRRVALGTQIKSYRQQAEMTQSELGEALAGTTSGDFPIPQTTVSRWESGSVELELEQIFAIETALKLKHGVLATAAGYIEKDLQAGSVEEMIRVDPRIHPDLRDEFVRIYTSYVKTSKALKTTEDRLERLRK